MTFARQYEQALTVKAASNQDALPPQYFAGRFYELLDSTACCLPTVLSGGSIELSVPCTLHFTPLDCRMLLYTQKGSGTLEVRGASHILQADSLLYLNCQDSAFTLSPAQPSWAFICFSLGGGLFNVYESFVPFKSFIQAKLDVFSPILRDLKKLQAGSGAAVLSNKLQDASLLTSIVTQLFITAYGLQADLIKCAPYLQDLKHLLDNRFWEPFRLNDLEVRYHMSKYRICHEFSDTFGAPPLKYLNKRRLEAAVNLLFTTDKKIHEIALMVGYENTNHFINLFKKEYGTTPHAYKEAHQL